MQIGLGAIVIILSISILSQPAIATVSLVVILAVILLIVGIERVIYGVFIRHKSRLPTIGFGILVIILAGIAIVIPCMDYGICHNIFISICITIRWYLKNHTNGVGDKESRGWARGFSIGVGILEIIPSIMILVSPVIRCNSCRHSHRYSIANCWNPGCCGRNFRKKNRHIR